LGLPIFPGHSEYDQVCRIVTIMGPIPQLILDYARATRRFFRRVAVDGDVEAGEGGTGAPPGAAHKASEDTRTMNIDGAVAQSSVKGASLSSDGTTGPIIATKAAVLGPGPQESTSAPSEDDSRAVSAADADASARDNLQRSESPHDESAEGLRTAEAKEAKQESLVPDGRGGVGPGAVVPPPRSRAKSGKRSWRLKTVEEYERDEHKKEPAPSKSSAYYKFSSLEEMLQSSHCNQGSASKTAERDPKRKDEEVMRTKKLVFLQFLNGCLQYNPNERWTPPQAMQHAFVNSEAEPAYDPNWAPDPDPNPVPNFLAGSHNLHMHATRYAPGPTSEAVPRLPAEASASSFVSLAPPAGVCAAVKPSTSNSSAVDLRDAQQVDQQAHTAAVPSASWASFASIPLPDSNPSERYRPSLDKILEEVKRRLQRAQLLSKPARSGQQSQVNSPHQVGSGAWSVSTGASFCSSASSRGSTPPNGLGRRPSPHSAKSARSRTRKPHSRGYHPHTTSASTDWKHLRGIGAYSGTTTGTPASSPHGSSASANVQSSSSRAPYRGHAGGFAHHRRAEGSREGSRGSSPWHLPSPSSEMSTASDRLNSSQPSGSDSCGEIQPEGGHGNYDGSEEDPARSDGHYHGGRSAPQSDSDNQTPRNLDAASHDASKDSQQARWGNMPQLSRMQLSRGRLHWGEADVAQSPGSGGNFREKVGIIEGGPVTPFGPGSRRDVLLHSAERRG